MASNGTAEWRRNGALHDDAEGTRGAWIRDYLISGILMFSSALGKEKIGNGRME